MIRALLLCLALAACTSPEPTTTSSAPPSDTRPRSAELAPAKLASGIVKVNNEICAVSRSRMAPDTLGRHVSRVPYRGADPRFQGTVFEFNQCCGGCVEKFPSMFAARPDEILAYHGVSLEALAAAREAVARE